MLNHNNRTYKQVKMNNNVIKPSTKYIYTFKKLCFVNRHKINGAILLYRHHFKK